MKRILKITFIIILFVLLGFATVIAQTNLIPINKKINAEISEKPIYILPSNLIKLVFFGHDRIASDIMWLKAVQYLGSHAKNLNKETMYKYLDATTDIDTKFTFAYQTGEWVLADKNDSSFAVKLGEKGLKKNPKAWEIPYYLGFVYFFYLEDYDKAADFYALASKIPGVLISARRMEASLRSKANKHIIALQMWLDIYKNTSEKYEKKLAEKKILREKNFLLLKKALKDYIRSKNRFPDKIEDLAGSGGLEFIPKDPEGMEYYLDSEKKIIDIR